MIGKVVRSESGSRTFGGLGNYLLRPEEIRDRSKFHQLAEYIGPETRGAYAFNGVTSAETAAVEMLAVTSHNPRVKQDQAAYHFLLAAQPGVDYSDEAMLGFARRALGRLKNNKAVRSLLEHQWLAVVHRDRAHTHVHVMVNLIDPVTFRTNYPSNDYEVLARVAREIDLEHGLEPTRQGALERRAAREALPARVREIEKHTGLPTFYARMKAEVIPALEAVLDDPAATRADFDRVLAERGVAYLPRGSGGVFVDRDEPERYHAPGGAFGSRFRLKALEQRLGTMFPPEIERRTFVTSGLDFPTYVRQRRGDVERAIEAGDGAALVAVLAEWGLTVRRRGGGYVIADAERPDDPERQLKITAVTSRARGLDRQLHTPIPRPHVELDDPNMIHESPVDAPRSGADDEIEPSSALGGERATGPAHAADVPGGEREATGTKAPLDPGERGPATSQATYLRRTLDQREKALAAAIASDPRQVLERMGRERATFTEAEFRGILRRRIGLNAAQVDAALAAARPELIEVQEADERDGTPRYTTRTMLAMERELVAVHQRLAQAADKRMRGQKLDPQLGTILTDGQLKAVEAMLGSKRFVALLGPGGTGKSFAIGAVRRAWERAGYQPIGASLSARAANNLADNAGIPSVTTAKLLYDLRIGRLVLHDRNIVVLDESGVIGSATRLEIAQAVERAGARLVTLGDRTQLQPIEAGGASRYLEDAFPENTVELREITRQRVPWEQDATLGFYEGIRDHEPAMVADALQAYLQRGKIVSPKDPVAAAVVQAREWRKNHGESILIATSTNALAREYAVAVQQDRIAHGELDSKQAVMLRVQPTVFDSIFIESRTYDNGMRAFFPGDRIVFKQRDKRLGVINGTLGTVLSVTAAGQFRVLTDEQREVEFTLGRYAAVDLGYATNVFKAQGATADRVIAIGAITDTANSAYVLLSRQRHEAIYFSPQSATKTIARLASGQAIRLKNGEVRWYGGIDRKDMALDYFDDNPSTLRRPADFEARARAQRPQTAQGLDSVRGRRPARKAAGEVIQAAAERDDWEAAIDRAEAEAELAARQESGGSEYGPDDAEVPKAAFETEVTGKAVERQASLQRLLETADFAAEAGRLARVRGWLELAEEIAVNGGRAALFEGLSLRSRANTVIAERDGIEAFRLTDRKIDGMATDRDRDAAMLLARVAWGGLTPAPQSTRLAQEERQRAEALGLRRRNPHLVLAASAPRSLGREGAVEDWRIDAAEKQRRAEVNRWLEVERVADAKRRGVAAAAYDASRLWRAQLGQLIPFAGDFARREAAIVRARNPQSISAAPWVVREAVARREDEIAIETLNAKAALARVLRTERERFGLRHGSDVLPSAFRSWAELELVHGRRVSEARFRDGSVAFTIQRDGRIDGFDGRLGQHGTLARVAALRFAGERHGVVGIDANGALRPGGMMSREQESRQRNTPGALDGPERNVARVQEDLLLEQLLHAAGALGVPIANESLQGRLQELERQRLAARTPAQAARLEIDDVLLDQTAKRDQVQEPSL